MANALIVNLFAGPGAGKTTIASSVFAELKWRGINSEFVTEFAKEIVWEGSFAVLDSEIYVLGHQLHRLHRVVDKVDVAVTDSPILLPILYNKKVGKTFDRLVVEVFRSFDNLNYVIERRKEYLRIGRRQSEEEARNLDERTRRLLDDNDISYSVVQGTRDCVATIADEIQARLEGRQK